MAAPRAFTAPTKRFKSTLNRGTEFRDIYDLYALRVLVDTKEDCYKTLGVIHQLWHPIPGQFDDYIANPKENMYQALHTTVICEEGHPLEAQVKTYELHQIAEYGVAATGGIKEGNSGDLRFEEKMTWLRQLLDWQREVAGTDEFIESVKQDIFHDQVFVYTPKGDIVELTAGSTAVDFAYKIHTELGHRCIGAQSERSLGVAGHIVAERRYRGSSGLQVGTGTELGLAQPQPRICRFRQRPAESPAMVPAPGPQQQH